MIFIPARQDVESQRQYAKHRTLKSGVTVNIPGSTKCAIGGHGGRPQELSRSLLDSSAETQKEQDLVSMSIFQMRKLRLQEVG